jgi:hypothetical protein
MELRHTSLQTLALLLLRPGELAHRELKELWLHVHLLLQFFEESGGSEVV